MAGMRSEWLQNKIADQPWDHERFRPLLRRIINNIIYVMSSRVEENIGWQSPTFTIHLWSGAFCKKHATCFPFCIYGLLQRLMSSVASCSHPNPYKNKIQANLLFHIVLHIVIICDKTYTFQGAGWLTYWLGYHALSAVLYLNVLFLSPVTYFFKKIYIYIYLWNLQKPWVCSWE